MSSTAGTSEFEQNEADGEVKRNKKAMSSTITERLDKAEGMVAAMAKEGRPPRMSIPARPEIDEDLFVCNALRAARAALSAAEKRVEELEVDLTNFVRLKEACEAWRAMWQADDDIAMADDQDEQQAALERHQKARETLVRLKWIGRHMIEDAALKPAAGEG